uniref:SID1 transmembrane family member 2 n=1 Tax=Panthera onca TaxID=9690 RepID=UPI002952AE3F|nr:SID1 transmembrane family member 2 [Panthera onca]
MQVSPDVSKRAGYPAVYRLAAPHTLPSCEHRGRHGRPPLKGPRPRKLAAPPGVRSLPPAGVKVLVLVRCWKLRPEPQPVPEVSCRLSPPPPPPLPPPPPPCRGHVRSGLALLGVLGGLRREPSLPSLTRIGREQSSWHDVGQGSRSLEPCVPGGRGGDITGLTEGRFHVILQTEGVRVSVNVLNKQKGAPLLFVVRQKEAVVSFQVPLILRGLYQRKYLYQKVERTLCQPPTKNESEVQFFYVDVSTLSPVNTTYQLRVSRMDDFVLRTGEQFSFNTTAAQPQYFKYEFPEGVDSVIVKVTSNKAFPCSVISIQDVLCPVYDLDNNVAFIGMYQTMTKKAAITVQRKDFPSNSFYVVVVVKTEDQACGGSLPFYPFVEDEPVDQGHRQKTLSVVVSRAVTSEAYVGGMLFCLGIFLSFYLLTILLACWENWRQRKKTLLVAMDRACPESASLLGNPRVLADAFPGSSPYEGYNYGSFENSSGSTDGLVDSSGTGDLSYSYQGHEWFKRRLPFGQMRQLCIAMDRSLDPVGARPRLDSMSSVEEDDYDTLTDIDSDKNVIRTKQYLYVADLARKDKRVLRKKYQIYFWNIATIAVFYALPVVQLVITYQTVVNVTGNQDICYYNFLCAHPLGNLSAFNNILSNLGYILLGLLFLLIILQREINHNRALLRNDLYALECGIPKHFGLFYAMGTALMMEGLLSACYHVCPNYTNFQFDTSFMYMIAGLCMLKLYQKRHPDINASAYSAYACLAIVIFFSVLGVVRP